MRARSSRQARFRDLLSSVASSRTSTAGLRTDADLVPQLQGSIGNRALRAMLEAHAGQLPAGSTGASSLRIGEDVASTAPGQSTGSSPASLRAVTRPGAAWPHGPITRQKSTEHDLAKYVAWVREVERAYGPDSQAVLQRLRRMYYSTYGGALGDSFDAVIGEQAGAEGVPLDSLSISFEALDGLYETDSVRTPDGDTVDVAHVLAALDLAVAGPSEKARLGEPLLNVRWAGVLTWTGDLAWWFVQWVEARRTLDATPPSELAMEGGPPEETGGLSASDVALMNELAKTKISKNDLLGDLDATVIAEESARPSTVEHVAAQRRRVQRPNIGTELSMPLSQILERYYGIGTGAEAVTATPSESRQRFANFVRHASPPIPHTTTGGGSVSLAAGAESAIHAAAGDTARLFLSRMRQFKKDGSDPVRKYDLILREMARRFTRFLATGLAKGDASWP